MVADRDRHAPYAGHVAGGKGGERYPDVAAEGVRDAGFDVTDGKVFEIHGVPPWLGDVVKSMIARLIALRMPGGPSSKMVPHMVSVWCEALMAMNIQWNEDLDKPRLRAAWKSMLPKLEQWPTPAVFLRHLPARVPQAALPPPGPTPEEKARARAILAGIADLLKRKEVVDDARGENRGE